MDPAFQLLTEQRTLSRTLLHRARWAVIIVLLSATSASYAGIADHEPEPQRPFEANLYLKVQPEHQVKMSALKPGDVLEGKLAQDVFSGERKVFPAGSSIRLTVDRLEKRRRVPNDHWPWLVKVFTPRHERYPTFQSAVGVLPDGTEIPLRVSLVSIGREVEVQAPAKPKELHPTGQPEPSLPTTKSTRKVIGPTITLQATEANPAAPSTSSLPSTPVTLLAGTQAKIILLDDVSASRNRAGDAVCARLVQPVWSGTQLVLPEGTLLEGKVVRSVPPRTLSRAGSLHLEFTNLTLPGGGSNRVTASLAGAQVDQGSHMRIDPEGTINAGRPGKAWMLINVGATAGIAKEVDDATQLVLEAIISTATDASTAGTSRIVSTCVSGIFMLTRHGRDVVLPKFAELSITFDRPVSFPAAPVTETSDASVGNTR
jgi:hypothetical protein